MYHVSLMTWPVTRFLLGEHHIGVLACWFVQAFQLFSSPLFLKREATMVSLALLRYIKYEVGYVPCTKAM